MVQDKALTQAVAAIPQRSERQQDLQKLVGSFVDVGILPQTRNINNQILYGRRGTGKTHVLRVLASELRQAPRNAVLYIDARTLGSTSQFSDATVPIASRCLALFRDVLGEIYNTLLDHIVNTAPAEADMLLDSLNELVSLITDTVMTYSAEAMTARALAKESARSDSEIGADGKVGLRASISTSSELLREQEKTTEYKITEQDKIIFPALSSNIAKILRGYGAALYLLIDEWSSLPLDIQPFLAEFFKRTFLPLPEVIIKIASLEYRSAFRLDSARGLIGFEIGADVSAAIDIDDYYVYDRNPARITEAFADMLYKHVQTELPSDYLNATFQVTSGTTLARRLFSDMAVFQELVRASEGVARDLINIFSHAYFSAHRRGKEKIDKAAVTEAARIWFEQDKLHNLDDTLQLVLRRIVEEVIGDKKARSFLLPRELGSDPLIQKLFDFRVLHVVQRGYADKDKPGVRYDIYTLDYGTYVNLMNTSKKPDLGFSEISSTATDDLIVPFDDRRSIRRIILSPDVLRT